MRGGLSTGDFFKMDYVFNTELAVEFGVEESIMLHNVVFWIEKNAANNKHLRDNRYWTYNSISAFAELFPFWSEGQVRRVIKSLISKGAIITGNYNDNKYDRTMWYALTDGFIENHKSICVNQIIHLSKSTNGDVGDKECIYTDVCTNTNTDSDMQLSRNNNGVTVSVTGEQTLFDTPKPKKRARSESKSCLFEDSKVANYEIFYEILANDPEVRDLGIDFNYYYMRIRNWSAAGGEKKKDWIATAKNWMLSDARAGKLAKVNTMGGGLSPDAIQYLKDMAD